MPTSFKKILLISSEFPPNVGGIGNHAYNLARALAKEGYDVTVLTDIIDVKQSDLDAFAATQNFKIHWITRKKLVIQTYLNRIFAALSLATSADKIILSGKFPLWVGNLVKWRYSKKEMIAVVHGTELDLPSKAAKNFTAISLRKVDKIISVSHYTKKFLPRNLPAHIQQFIIPNGINGAEFSGSPAIKLAGHPALITIGNVTDRKGQENVIKALPQIKKQYPSVCYHIVGKPTNKARMSALAIELQVDQHVVFYGAVSRDELLQKLKAADVKLMLSNHTSEGDFEGFGIAVLEANAFGVPAIGSKNSGIADAIEDGKTGILVNQYNSQQVADAVVTILNNYESFSHQAKKWALQHDWNIIVKRYKEVLGA